ncbi:MAG: hypothetical protein HQL55_19400 [Magnetococcales bacterium]|nr:hypothetical protein [Magnetococcales bacterium]
MSKATNPTPFVQLSDTEKEEIIRFVGRFQSKATMDFLVNAATERQQMITKQEEKRTFEDVQALLKERGLTLDDFLRKHQSAKSGRTLRKGTESGSAVSFDPNLIKKLKEMAGPQGLYNPNAEGDKLWGGPGKQRWKMVSWLSDELHTLRSTHKRIMNSDLKQLADKYAVPVVTE